MDENDTAFSDILASLKVSGQVLLVDEYQPPWGIDIPDGSALCKALDMPTTTKVVPFHIVRRGLFELHSKDNVPLIVRSGEVAICTGSHRHQMIQGHPKNIASFADLVGSQINAVNAAGVRGATELVCGVFIWQNVQRNPLVDSLPPVVHTDVSGQDGGKTLELLTQLLVSELRRNRAGYDYMAARFVELLCAESIRQYLDRHVHEEPGWFRAMRDSKIGIALNMIHAAPETSLSVASLAADVGMSSSRFAARFRGVLGESVMSYVGRWRMNIAGRLLMDSELNIDQIASRVGYESSASFSRAFSKFFDAPPSQWRNQQP